MHSGLKSVLTFGKHAHTRDHQPCLITMKIRALFLSLLLPTLTFAAEPAASDRRAKIEDAILNAARAGEAPAIGKLIIQSFEQRGSLDEGAVKAMLDGLVRSGGELPAFTVLLEREPP